MSGNGTQQKLVRVNSRYRSAGSVSDFTMQFTNKELDGARTVAIVRASLPRMFPNIYSPINEFVYNIDSGPEFSFSVPEGQYTAETLAVALDTAGGADWVITYSPTTHRFNFDFHGAGLQAIILADRGINGYLGVTSNLDAFFTIPVDAQGPPQLSGPNECYLESNLIASSNCCDVASLGSYIPFTGFIDFSRVEYGFNGSFIQYERNNFEVNYRITQGQQTIRTFDMRITDRFGNVLPLPGNAFLDMHLCFTYELP